MESITTMLLLMMMTTKTKTRKMPASYYTGAPKEVKDRVAYIITLPNGPHAAGMTHEILLVDKDAEGNTVGIDLGPNMQGQHFFLSSVETRAYKQAYGKHKVCWRDLPEVMQQTITAYLKHS